MPRQISAENFSALQQGKLVARDFLWIVGRTRISGAPISDGTWSGIGNITAEVVDPDTGGIASRDWYGSGTLVQISDIPLVANLSVQHISAIASQINNHVEQLVREYDIRQAKVEIFRGLFNPETRMMVDPAECRFVGLVDNIRIVTPEEGGEGSVNFDFVSQTQDLNRSNPDTRSHETQKLRLSYDDFLKDAATTSSWKVWWGSQQGQVPTVKKRKKFLGLF